MRSEPRSNKSGKILHKPIEINKVHVTYSHTDCKVMSSPITTNQLLETRETVFHVGSGIQPSRDLKSREIIPPRVDGGYPSRLFRITLASGFIHNVVYWLVSTRLWKALIGDFPNWLVHSDYEPKGTIFLSFSIVLDVKLGLILLLLVYFSLCC